MKSFRFKNVSEATGISARTIGRMARDGRITTNPDRTVPQKEVLRMLRELKRSGRNPGPDRAKLTGPFEAENKGGRVSGRGNWLHGEAWRKTRPWPSIGSIEAMECSPLRKAVLKRHHTYTMAAALLGMAGTGGRVVLCQYINSKRRMSDRVLTRILEVYGLDPQELRDYHDRQMANGKD